MLEFRILGPLEVCRDGQPVALPGRASRRVLAALLVRAGEWRSGERLIDELWGERPPESARKALQMHVSRLRRALDAAEPSGASLLASGAAGYRLEVAPEQIDAALFERLVDDARRAMAASDVARARELLVRALTLWRGAPLAELDLDAALAAELARLEELRLDALEQRIEADVALGGHAAVVAELHALLGEHPLRERLHAHLMLALYRCGRQADALEAYRDARRVLNAEIGVEPGPELRRLQQAILRHDRQLEPTPLPVELPPELDADVAPPLVGRDAELAWLRGHWERAQGGSGALVGLVGAREMGKTRMAAELATHAHRLGVTVLYARGTGPADALRQALGQARKAARPTLLVIDDADRVGAAVRAELDTVTGTLVREPALALVTGQDAAALERLGADHVLTLEPLDVEAVHAIAEPYAPGHAGEDVPAEWMHEASGGVPGRVHALARQWAGLAAARRVGVIAGRAAAGRTGLRSIEADLADSVIELQTARDRNVAVDAPEAPVTCPFKGLAAFERADAPYFFGRERLVAELVARLVGAPLLALVGPSGSGKSSVMRAGLLPTLSGGVLPGSGEWTQLVIRPGEHPARELRSAQAGIDGDRQVVLAVDQFEETFTACPDERERRAFIDALVRTARDPGAGGVVVLAVRADLYGRCAAYPALSALLAANHVLIGPMRRDELRRAIELPARRVGLGVEPELVDALLTDVDGEPGGLPLLSTALLALWQHRDGPRLRLAAYANTGGVHGAVARLAEEAYALLEPGEQAVARSMLLRMAAEGPGGVVVRRRVALAEFEDHGDGELARVLAVLTDKRLLTMSATSVEVAHEALLREWPRLRRWLEEDAQGRRTRRQLSDAAREWDEGGRDPGDVYQGARLAVALEWRAQHERELNATERAFLEAGRAASQRAQRRLWTGLAGVGALLVLAIAGGVLALRQRAAARAETRSAQAQRLGIQALTEPDLDRALLLARQGVELDDSPATRGNLLTALLRSPAAIGVMHGDAQPLGALDLRADGRALAVADSRGSVLFFDAGTRRRVGRPYRTHGPINIVRFSPDGTRLVVAGPGDPVAFLEMLDGHTYQPLGTLADAGPTVRKTNRVLLSTPLEFAVFSPDSRVLVILAERMGLSSDRLFIQRWDARTRRPLGPPAPVTGVAQGLSRSGGPAVAGYTGDGSRIVISSSTGTTVVLDALTLRPVRRFDDGGSPAAVSPDGRVMAFGGFSGSVHLLDLNTGRLSSTGGRHDGPVTDLQFTPDSRRLITTGSDGRLIVHDARNGTHIETLEGHAGAATAVAVAPDGSTAYSASRDASVIAWDLVGSRRLVEPFPAMLSIPIPVSADTSSFALPGPPGAVDVLDSRTLTRTRRLEVSDSQAVTSMAMAPDGRALAAITEDGQLTLMDVRSGRPLLPPKPGNRAGPAFSDDGRWLATTAGARTVRIWDARNLKLVGFRVLPGRSASNVNLSPDGTTMVATVRNEDGTARIDIRSVPRLNSVRRVHVPDGQANGFSLDGRRFLYGDTVGRVWLYDTHTWKPYGRPLDTHAGPVLTASLSPDDSTLATTSTTGTTRLWDVRSGRPIGIPLISAANQQVSAAFVQDGAYLIAVSQANGYRWDVRPQAWARKACEVAGRTLTRKEWADALPERRYAPACTQH